MAKIILLAAFLIFPFAAFSQTVTTRDRCHLLTDKYNLQEVIAKPLSQVSIDIIPKGVTLPVLEIDSVEYLFARVQYKKQTGWVHRNMLVDRSIFIKSNPKVRDGYADGIRNGQIIYGMNEEEKELAIGIQNKANNKTIIEDTKLRVGFDLGYTTGNYLVFDGSISKGDWYYGLSFQMNVSTGEKGKSYDGIIDWNNDLDRISESGEYCGGVYGFDLGYYFKKNFCLGVGIGYADFRKYRNFHDDMEILSQSGWYHVTKSDGGKMDAKAFVHYYFKEGLFGRCYLKGQYSIIGGAGFGIGFQL